MPSKKPAPKVTREQLVLRFVALVDAVSDLQDAAHGARELFTEDEMREMRWGMATAWDAVINSRPRLTAPE